jgi:RHS repeat-associated protein
VVILSRFRPVVAVIVIALCIPVAVLSRLGAIRAGAVVPKSQPVALMRVGAAIATTATAAILTSPRIPPGTATTIPASGSNPPDTGTWDIVLNGNIIATNSNALNWNVTYANLNLTITVPSNQPAATAFEARFSEGSTVKSATFDVVPRITAGGVVTFWVPIGTACPSPLEWDIVRNGSTVATSASPNGWTASRSQRSWAAVLPFAMHAPYNAVIGQNYEFRYSDGHSTPFDIGYSVPTNIHPGVMNGVLEDAMTLPAWMEHLVPTDTSDAPGGGPSSAISIDLVHGVATVDGDADIVASNPNGDDVIFARRYRSVLAAGNLSSPGLATGWTHNWDYRIVPLSQNSWGSLQLVFPNGASELLVPIINEETHLPTGSFLVSAGVPYIASGTPSATEGVWDQISLKHNGLSKEVFTLTGGTVYRLTQEVGDNGSLLNLSYTSQILTQIQSQFPGGPSTTLLDIGITNGAIITVSDPVAGHTRSFGYSNGELATVSQINTANTEWSYSYTLIANQPYVNSVQTPDPHGTNRVATISYDSTTGRATSLMDAKGQSHGYTFAFGQGGSVEISGPTGVEDQYGATADQAGRIVSVTTAAGDTTTVGYGGVDPSVTTTVTRPLGAPLISLTDSHGNVTKTTYPYGNHTDYTWEYPAVAPFGRITKVQEFGNNGTSKLPITYEYYGPADPEGLEGYLKEIAYPYGGYEAYKYTAKGNVATVTGPTSTITYGYTTKFGNVSATERLGQPYSVHDLLGRTSWFDYDNNGNLTWTRDPMGNESSDTLNQYGQPNQISMPMGRYLTIARAVDGKAPTSATLSGPSGSTTLFQNTYDAEAATHVTTDANGNSNTSNLNGHFGLSNLLNGNGRPMHGFTPLPADRAFQATYGIGSHSVNVRAVYDQNGRQQSSGPMPGLASNGITTAILPNLNDGLRDLPSQINTSLSSPVRGAGETLRHYDYDAFGRVTNISTSDGLAMTGGGTLFSGGTNHFTYDDLDRVIYSDAFYEYNPDGTRHKMHFGPGTTAYQYYYDAAQRITRIEVNAADPPSTIAWVNYEYDANDHVLAVRTPKATTLYAYNVLGQLTSLYNLTPDNKRDYLAPPGQYLYTEPNGTFHSILSAFTNITYNSLGNRTGYSMVMEMERGRGNSYHPVDYYSRFEVGGVSFAYDSAGRLTQENWSFPVLGGTCTLNHAYDAAGNLIQLRGPSWTIDPQSDQVLSTTFPNFGAVLYNDNGDVSQGDGHLRRGQYEQISCNYSYLPSGSLGRSYGLDSYISVFREFSLFTELYRYDANGRRCFTWLDAYADPRVDWFQYDGSSLLSRSGTVFDDWLIHVATDIPYPNYFNQTDSGYQVSYLWGPTGPIMEFGALGSRAFLFDPQGNCLNTAGPTGSGWILPNGSWELDDGLADYPMLYDGYGEPLFNYQYMNYGEPNYGGYAGYKRWLQQPLQYKGQYGYYCDSHTGLYYCMNRYYDPKMGRWLSRDPIGLEGGVNVYQYCGGNPIMFADPSGLQGLPDYGNKVGQVFSGYWQAISGIVTGIPAASRRCAQHLITPGDAGYMSPLTASALTHWDGLTGMWGDVVRASDGDCEAFGRAWMTTSMMIAGSKIPAIRGAKVSTWQESEAWIAARYGGDTQVFFRTAVGKRRFVDTVARGWGHESKFGKVGMSPRVRAQIRSDYDLIMEGQLTGSTWHFFNSPRTGIGPSASVRAALRGAGIKVKYHK